MGFETILPQQKQRQGAKTRIFARISTKTVTLYKAANFIKEQSGFSANVKDFDCDKISSLLLNEKPVLLWLNADGGGHVVIVDAVDYHESSGLEYYAYISPNGGSTYPDPTPGPPSTSADPEYDALVAKYGEIVAEPYCSSTSYFRFIWGYQGKGDDAYYINGDVLSLYIIVQKKET